MKRKIFMMCMILVSLGAWMYFNAPKAESQPRAIVTAGAVMQPATAINTATLTPVICSVSTGLNGGRVNLRTCAGVSCAVLSVLREGENLAVLAGGEWYEVTTASGLQGYINSNYCK